MPIPTKAATHRFPWIGAPDGILGQVSRPRRSLLYVPASSERMIAKAATRGADVLVLDLEDGVHRSHKDAARERLHESRATMAGAGAAVALRTNPPEGPGGQADLEAAATARFDAVLLPKAESGEIVRVARDVLGRATPLWLMIETAPGAANVFDLARLPGVEGLVFGSADYRLSVGSRPGDDESDLDFVRQRILLASRAAGIYCWDAPWFAFRDLEGLSRGARRAAEAGFDGKSAVHPAQIPVIHEAFAPTAEERAWAERVVRVMEDAAAREVAVVELDGELLEELHLRQARRLLAR
ncbi:MAG: CoA ester lyase [Acidobacteriota bacterium]|nr:CoA ester lyase [Acidobacteriota bacterium]